MLKWQLIVLAGLSAGGLLINVIAAYSVMCGAGIYIVPNIYFSLYAFRYRGAQLAPWIARSFSWGESGKFALAAVGFALVFNFVQPLNVAMVFAGFCSMIILQWFVARKISDHLSRACQREEATDYIE